MQDHIYSLVEKAIATQNSEELDVIITDLRAALREHAERLRQLAASQLV